MIEYRKLDVYWEARRLGKDLFKSTSRLPLYLKWRLGGQIDSAIDSIGANLAEGCGRKNASHGNIELLRYGHMAHGSACEVEHRIAALHDRGLIPDDEYQDFARRIDGLKAKLWRLIAAWKREDRGKQS
jgi:four helix bundle protein